MSSTISPSIKATTTTSGSLVTATFGSHGGETYEYWTNVTVVTDKIWPNVTCEHNSNTDTARLGYYDAHHLPQGVAIIGIAPLRKENWETVLRCAGDVQNITITDASRWCRAEFLTDPERPGAAWQCLDSSNEFQTWDCAGDVAYGCATTAIPQAQITSHLASSTSFAGSTSTTASTARTTTASASPSTGAAAGLGKTKSVGKVELAIASLLGLSMVFGMLL